VNGRAERLGVVAIGRNEGERLHRCLTSVVGRGHPVVYVDSGSSDSSREYARSLGVHVVELDTEVPFTAARARNAGFDCLVREHPDVDAVQFLDGDCEVVEGWLDRGLQALVIEPTTAVVSGRRRERYPHASVYNLLVDMEWDTPIGQVDACHGDAMMRRHAFESVGGFNPSLIAGEEPELCVRLRTQGWAILRIDAEMTLHDAAMTRFGQFWKRSQRAGHAFAEGAWIHGAGPYRHCVRSVLSTGVWALALPGTILAFAPVTRGASVLGGGLYALLGWRIFSRKRRAGYDRFPAAAYAAAVVVAKFAEAQGMLGFVVQRLLGRRSTLIEYKGPTPQAS